MAADLQSAKNYQPSAEKPVLLFIEGKNPFYFIQRVYRPEPVALLDFGSVSALRDRLSAALAARNFFQYVKRVAVIRDAEGSDAAAAQSVQDAFLAQELSSPETRRRIFQGCTSRHIHRVPDSSPFAPDRLF